MPKIRIDEKKCTGCGLCMAICEKTFEMKGEKAKVKRKEVKDLTCEKEAMENCPEEAIMIS